MSHRLLLSVCFLLSACIAPGGIASSVDGLPQNHGSVLVSSGLGGTAARQSQENQISAGFRPARFFAIEGGIVHSIARFESDEGNGVLVNSALPYLRPTLVIKRFTLGAALSGLGAGGGGGGAAWGVAGLRAGYGNDRIGGYAEWIGHVNVVVSSDTTESSSQQKRIGLRVARAIGKNWTLGLATELYQIDEEFLSQGQHFEQDNMGFMLKLSVHRLFRD